MFVFFVCLRIGRLQIIRTVLDFSTAERSSEQPGSTGTAIDILSGEKTSCRRFSR